ncbi:MAG: homoserine dehydrogenase [Nitrospiraceae bacterium]|nr:MAG: homoserine dehydrogenase [Nitrospiraceae bacterium]
MKDRIAVGLIGFGTVGTGVARVLTSNAGLIRRRLGVPLELVKVADLNLTADRGVALPAGVLTSNAREVIDDPKIDIVIELVGGYDPAKQFLLDAMAKGKSVVTANKALLAVHGEELFQAAARAKVDIGFEASVGGGIPIVRTLTEGLAANRILSLYGIVNGTSNYILTRMTEAGRPFDEVLAEAQKAGYAEADPAFDIAGTDAAHKLAILITLAFGTPVNFKDVYVEGITGITPMDIAYATEFGYTIKLLAIAKLHEGEAGGRAPAELEARVHPTMIASDAPIARVGGVYNAIQVTGDAVGDIMLYGRGAGSLPTASAVVSDVIDMARNILSESVGRVPSCAFQADQRRPLRIRPIDEVGSLYYLRFMVLDKPGVLSQLSGVLGGHEISISSVLQRGRRDGQTVPVVMTTHLAVERNMQAALREIAALPFVSGQTTLVRIEGEDR